MAFVQILITFIILGNVDYSTGIENIRILQQLQNLNKLYEFEENELLNNKIQLQTIGSEKGRILESMETIKAKRRASSPVMFHARLSGSYSQMSPKQLITFDSVYVNIGNGYDYQFGVFTAPISGTYEFITTVWANTGYFVNVEMNKNTHTICKAHAASYQSMGICSAMVHLNIGDDVFVRHHNGEGRYLYGSLYPSFSGHLIYAD